MVVFANLPQIVPRVSTFLGSAAFCHFEPRNQPPGDAAHAGDRLPSAVSMVQHLADGGSSVRLCSVDIDRAAGGDRTHLRTLQGHHPKGSVRLLLPHPSLPLVASIGSDGELMLWECALLPGAVHPGDAAQSSLASGAEAIAEAAADTEQGAARRLLRVPGSHSTVVWPIAAAAVMRLDN